MEIAYVNVFVSDLTTAIAFYEGTLGLKLEFSEPENGYASVAAGPVRLGLAVPGPDEHAYVGRHTGVGLSVSDLEEEFSRLTGLGVSFAMPPTKQLWGGFMALVKDPDGNVFYLDQISEGHP
jgi:lactoylglutathione lyase